MSRETDYAEMMPDKIKGNGVLNEWLRKNGFFTAPASTKYHGAYEGGLFDHSYTVANELVNLTVMLGLKWERTESPYIVGMFHDLCKVDRYWHNGEGYEYLKDTLLDGHGAKSVMMLASLMQLTEEEVMCIRYHMGAYEKDDWAGYDLAIKKYPNVLWTHTADMVASKIVGC